MFWLKVHSKHLLTFRVSTLLVIYFELAFVFAEANSTCVGLRDVEIKIC